MAGIKERTKQVIFGHTLLQIYNSLDLCTAMIKFFMTKTKRAWLTQSITKNLHNSGNYFADHVCVFTTQCRTNSQVVELNACGIIQLLTICV